MSHKKFSYTEINSVMFYLGFNDSKRRPKETVYHRRFNRGGFEFPEDLLWSYRE